MEPSATDKTPVSNRVFLLLCVMAFIMYVDRTNISVAAPILKQELQLTNTQLGLVFSAFATAYACCGVPGAWLSDRFGARRLLTLSGLIWSVATIATGLVWEKHALVPLLAGARRWPGRGRRRRAPRRRPA